MSRWDYGRMKRLLADECLPAGIVHLDALEANTRRFAEMAGGKRVRIATKSLRVPDLLRVVLAAGGPEFGGLMAYNAREAAFLGTLGFDDIFVAYPTTARIDIEALLGLARDGRRVSLAVDSAAHVEAIEAAAGPRLGVVIDVDVSLRPFGDLHLGVRRSPIRTLADFARLHDRIASSPAVRLAGVMAYEAQVAGLPDRNPYQAWMNPAKRAVKALSRRDIRRRRAEIAAFLATRGTTIDFFNGGGTGSFAATAAEAAVTEVTVGSGLLQSRLFDYFGANVAEPAFAFALPVTRVPEPGVVTCQSGGFIASGETSPDKSPVVFLPADLVPFATENFGEVQTPLRGNTSALRPGDPILFRPAKAGEIAERFAEYLLIRDSGVVARAPTYRGLGQCFF